MMAATQAVDILLVEDSPDDIFFIKEAFAQSKVLNRIHVMEDGEKALKFLHKEGEYVKAPRPRLILLDLNLPKKSGQQVLAEIRADEMLMDLPVVILTTSCNETDILKSYRYHANCYITKPVDVQEFMDIVLAIEHFWLSVALLPSEYRGI
ncbi:MAG: response regulator receiver protein [uncultured bacterium]|nr:MAG: response regulator receiver protein [uncultured bacterium]